MGVPSGLVAIGSVMKPGDALNLTDAQGRMLDVRILSGTGSLQMALSHLPDGLYFRSWELHGNGKRIGS